MNNDARKKLRDMGGIMASSPELMQVAQKFQDGGPLMRMPPTSPNFSPRMLMDQTVMGRGLAPSAPSVPALAGTMPIAARESAPSRVAAGGGGISMADWRQMSRQERKRAGLPVSEIGAQFFFDRFGVGMGLVDPDALYTSEGPVGVDDLLSTTEGSAGRLGSRSDAPPYTEGEFESVSPGRSGTRRPANPTALRQEADALRSRAEGLRGDRGGRGQQERLIGQAEALEEAARDNANVDTTDDARAGRGFGRIGDVVARATPDPEKTNDLLPRVEDILNNEPPPGGGDDTPPPQAKRDLRSRYNEKLEFFKEIYGTDDKDEAQDRAMSLAMIGLAIAAGQSPDALTNIAQGAMVGLQGMGAQREAARDRERGMRTLALETAIGQQDAEASAEAEAAQTALEQANRLELEEFKARVGAMYGGAGGSRDARNIIDFAQNTYNEALKAASAQTAPDFNPEEETPHQYAMRQSRAAAQGIGQMFPGYGGQMPSGDGAVAPPQAPEIPTITTKAEYDALPSGARFMQNGQLRDKP